MRRRPSCALSPPPRCPLTALLSSRPLKSSREGKSRSAEEVQLPELLREQVVDGEAAVAGAVAHLFPDLGDRGVQRLVAVGQTQPLLQEILPDGLQLLRVAEGD